MTVIRARTATIVVALLASALTAAPVRALLPPPDGRGDATVVAVIDSAFTPYHWDFLASKMPQANDADATNDLPLDEPPDRWLPGFPDPSGFASYARFDLTLDNDNPFRTIKSLDDADLSTWGTVRRSTASAVNYYWLPGTKVIGAMTFSAGKIHALASAHGTGTSSVSVGNLFGACPECLAVLIQYGSAADGEAAIGWAMKQPWIDAITNSYGFSLVERDRFYSGSDTEAQRAASERGQTVFFSAGNGISNTFTVPNSTYFSSQEGPDWIVTVGAVAPTNGGTYTGAGKPADIAGVGGGYPSAYTATYVGSKGSTGFSGTSNATPTIAGTYARALYLARRDLAGSSTTQSGGVVAIGEPFACGVARECELGDGVLTAAELRARLFAGAVHTPAGLNPGGTVALPPVGEDEFAGEGYGTYFARLKGDEDWAAEFERLLAPLEGRALPPARPAGESEWMIVDSFCRQHLWGEWSAGSYRSGATPLPGTDTAYPLRSTIEAVCPSLFPPV